MNWKRNVMYLVSDFEEPIPVYVPRRMYLIGDVVDYTVCGSSTRSGQGLYEMTLFESWDDAFDMMHNIEN